MLTVIQILFLGSATAETVVRRQRRFEIRKQSRSDELGEGNGWRRRLSLLECVHPRHQI